MPKKKVQESQEAQSERFRKAVRDLIDAGELSPIEAEEVLDKAMTKIIKNQSTRK